MKKEEFVRFPFLGVLTIEQVLFSYDIPLLFTCNSSKGGLYLVLCVSMEANEYVAARVTKKIIKDVLNDKIPLRQPFVKPYGKLYYLVNNDKMTDCKEINVTEVPLNMLPPIDAFLNYDMK